LSCHDGEFGITDQQEQIFTVDPSGHAKYAAGPHLTPFVSGSKADSRQLFELPVVNGQPFPPVPIVAIGHFDDPRAAECGTAALKRCEDRFVLDSVAIFDPTVVATPAPTVSPTAFPDAAPSGLFDPSAPGVCAGDVPYTFIGWTTTAALKVGFERPGHVWAAVTKDPALLGGPAWNRETEGGGPAFRWWGRRVCLATEAAPDVILYDAIPGTTYKEWEDGTITHAEVP
jgi:hypothetical protein